MKSILLGALALTLSTTSAFAASWNEESHAGFSSVHMYVPTSQSPVGEGRALMINLHGCAQANTELKGANWDKVADQWGMVVALPYAEDMAGMSCWGYWVETEAGTKPTRNTKDYARLINLAKELINDTSLNIDPKQVYISGLSSGATFANFVACLAPDVFAGVGTQAGPSIGTSSSGAISAFEKTDVAANCLALAGSNSDHFKTQIASFSRGSNDSLVSPQYLPQNVEGFAKIYGVSVSGKDEVSENGSTADITNYGTRLSSVVLNGDGHAWSGGQGASGAYVGSGSVNYGMYLAEFFANNNKRLKPADPLNPNVDTLNASVSSGQDQVTFTGSVDVADGTYLAKLEIEIDGQIYSVVPNENFSHTISLETDADYYATVTATTFGLDDNKERSASKAVSFTLGTPFVPASWCSYLSEELQKNQSACTPPKKTSDGEKELPSWCQYISDTTYVTACQE